MDSENYDARHPGALYGEYGTSALHFRLAFRHRSDAPYNGRDDAPAYDYWSGFPAYDNGDGPTATANPAHLLRSRHGPPARPPGRKGC